MIDPSGLLLVVPTRLNTHVPIIDYSPCTEVLGNKLVPVTVCQEKQLILILLSRVTYSAPMEML
jgi:hypothetical protein